MKKIILSAIVLASISLTSCKDDDDKKADEGTVDISKMYLPLKMSGDGYSTVFNYNNKGQVVKIAESDGFEYTFTYNGTQLTEFVEKESSGKTTYTFTQSGTTVTLKMVGEYSGEKYEDTTTLTIDANGNLINDGYFTYSYDSAGNNVKIDDGEGSVANLTFDAKSGIFKNLNLPKWLQNYLLGFNTNDVNNAVSFKFESKEDPEDNNSSIVTYTYNADGYPTKASSVFTDNTGTKNEVQTIEYTKK